MSVKGAAILGLMAGAALLLVMRQAGAATVDAVAEMPEQDAGGADAEPFGSIGQDVGFELVGYDVQDANIKAFLMLIRSGESSTGNEAYRMIVGGGAISDYADHPRIYKQINGHRTSAAGAYQITATTWDDLRRAGLLLRDFSPACQDQAAVALIRRRGALADVIAGRFGRAIAKCRAEWTSLPGAAEQLYSMQTAMARLVAYGATIREDTVYA